MSTSPPGPATIPLLGWRGHLIPFLKDPLKRMLHLHAKFGEISSIARGRTEFVFAFGPEMNRKVLGDPELFNNLDLSSSPLRIPSESSLSRLFAGLTHMNGPRHAQQRRLMGPALTRHRIEGYCAGVVLETSRMLDHWRAGQGIDLYAAMRELTLSIAVRTFLGLDSRHDGGRIGRLLEEWTSLVFSFPAIMLPFRFPRSPYARLLRTSERLEGNIRALIQSKRRAGTGQDVLSVLMGVHDQDDTRLTDDELIGQTNFLFMAGHATTASALTWTLFLLLQHPELFRRVREECLNAESGCDPACRSLARLELLQASLEESMRLLPPVIWWGKVGTAPFRLGPYHFPCGARVITSAYVTHRIAGCFRDEPGRFNPERWLGGGVDAYEYVPFSAGPRMCLGASFAMTEMKIILSGILQRFSLSLPSPSRVDVGGLMLAVPKNGLAATVEPRGAPGGKAPVEGNIRRVVDLD